MIKGIAASSGIAIAKVYLLEKPDLQVPKDIKSVDEELALLENASEATRVDIEKIKEVASKTLSEDEVAIFDAHLAVLGDPEFLGQVKEMVQSGEHNAAAAIEQVSGMFVSMFENMDDAYFKERAADIRDVSYRLLAHAVGETIPNLSLINEEVIIVAEDLTPSDTAQLNKALTLGFATEIGGRTSHSAIMARSLEIPAVVGCTGILKNIKHGQHIILDAMEGKVILHPTEEEITTYRQKKAEHEAYRETLKVLVNEPSVTLDGHEVIVAGNIGNTTDAQGVINYGGEAIGLYRTEFLYMDAKDFPTEEEQYQAYKEVLENMDGKQVIIRTLDIGGDKKLDYFELPEELNPFLGFRAVRLCLGKPEIFRTQLRALLRASVHGRLGIMFPMIATLQEFRDAKALLDEERANLLDEGHQVNDNLEVGIMVEIPAAAVLAEKFAQEVDFFSIGTNDLIQYTMAADRMNQQVSYLYQELNPSILRLIKMTIDGAHKHGKWVGMCGEMAADPMAVPVLLGLGLDEFSVSATSILQTRKIIREATLPEMQELAQKALDMGTRDEVAALVEAHFNK